MFQDDGSGLFDRERSLVDYLLENKMIEEANRKGFIMWEGKQISKDALSDLIRAEGEPGFEKLKALLPDKTPHPVIATV